MSLTLTALTRASIPMPAPARGNACALVHVLFYEMCSFIIQFFFALYSNYQLGWSTVVMTFNEWLSGENICFAHLYTNVQKFFYRVYFYLKSANDA